MSVEMGLLALVKALLGGVLTSFLSLKMVVKGWWQERFPSWEVWMMCRWWVRRR